MFEDIKKITIHKIRLNNTVFIPIFAAVLLTASCKNWEDFRDERIEKAAKHYDEISGRSIPSGKVLTLPDCIHIALKNNLDLEVGRLREKVAQEQKTAELLGMLPELVVTDNWSMRSNRPASSSQSITTGGATYNYSQSQDKWGNELKIELALSVIDFGLAYLNSAQAQDKTMVESEQLRRAEQNLTLEIVKTYFKVASTQDAISTTEELLKKCEGIESTIKELAAAKQVSPFRLFDEHKRFIRIQQRLMEYRKNYEDGCIELRSLMGILPSSDIKLDTSPLQKLPVLELPDIELLEKAALIERPELYHLDIQSHITLTEARKTILLMMPNVRIFADFNNTSNSFVYHTSWMELGVRAAYNLLQLPKQIAKYRSLNKEMDAVEMQTLSLAVAVMAQVRIAHSNLLENKKKYELDERIYDIYNEHQEYAQESYQTGSMLSQLEMDCLRMETAETKIQKTLSMGSYYVAYYRLMNTVGLDDIQKDLVKKLAEKVENNLKKAEKKTEN